MTTHFASTPTPVTLLRLKRAAGEPLPDVVHVRVKRRRLDHALQSLSLSSAQDLGSSPAGEPAPTRSGGLGSGAAGNGADTVVFRRVRATADESGGRGRATQIIDVDGRVVHQRLASQLDHNSTVKRQVGSSGGDSAHGGGGNEDTGAGDAVMFARNDIPIEHLQRLGYGRDGQHDGSNVLYLDGDDIPELAAAVDSDESDDLDESDLDAQSIDYPSMPEGSEKSWRVRSGRGGYGEEDDGDGGDDDRYGGWAGDASSDGEDWERYERFGKGEDFERYDSEL